MARVILKNIVKKFGDNVVIENVNLEARDKEFLVLVGPSGCGKTTTLRMIAGLEEVTDGEIYIGEREVSNVLPKDRNIAMVFQNYALYPHMSVYENMSFSLKLRKISKNVIKQRVEEASEILGLGKLLKRKPKQLSGGQRQRVALGRAIVRHPAVFLMDEPLSNLDAKLRVQTRGELKKLHQRLNATVVYVTHDQVEAMTLGDRIIIMHDGKIQQADSPVKIYDNPQNIFVGGFIGSPPMNFFSGQVVKNGEGKFVFQTANFKVWLPDNLYEEFEKVKERDLVLGVRPEYVLDKESARHYGKDFNIMKARIDFCEILGAENYIHLSIGSDKLIAKVESHINPLSGEEIEIAIDLGKMHLFDPSTKESII